MATLFTLHFTRQNRSSYFIWLLLATLLLPLTLLGQPSQVRDHARISQHYGLLPPEAELFAEFGTSVANIGDIDGDGVTDLAVGDPTFTNDVGAVYILFLRDDGTVRDYRRITKNESGFTPTSDHLNEANDLAFGASIASIGDLDGDGLNEVAVYESGENATYILFLNADGSVQAYQRFQSSVYTNVLAGVGDLNGDGIPDMAAVLSNGTTDTVVFFLDKDGTEIGRQELITVPGFRRPEALAPIGDLDGDGVGDLFAGSTKIGIDCDPFVSCQGFTYIHFMNDDGTIRETVPLGPGAEGYAFDYQFSNYGAAVAGMGDVDGDGVVDVAIGAPGQSSSDEGAVHVVLLNKEGTAKDVRTYVYPALFNETLEQAYYLGRALAPLGDLDGNGTPDFAAGARYISNNGELDIFLLEADGEVTDRHRILDEVFDANQSDSYALLDLADNDLFGESAVTIGDVDGDGVDDVAVGARGTGAAGGVWVLFMRDDGTVRDATRIDGEDRGKLEGLLDANDRFGDALAAPGDLNDDGTPDLIVGAPRDDDGASDAGAVWILYLDETGAVGDSDKISATEGGFEGDLESDAAFGSAIAVLNDIDGDGHIEIAVGANETGGLEGDLWILFLGRNNVVQSHRRIDDKDADLAVDIQPGDKFGSALATLPDMDGNGVQELAVGAEGVGAVNQGAVHILFLEKDGRVLMHTTLGDGAGGFDGSLDNDANFGTSLANMTPNQRGAIPQLAVGASGQGSGGAVWLLPLNSNGTASASYAISETEGGFIGDLGSNDNFGSSVAALGDLDDDSVPDLFVGAPAHDEGGSNRGAAWVLFLEDLVNPPPMYTISVVAQDTTGAALNVPISLSPVDAQGIASGVAPFTATYRENTLAQLSAPDTFGDYKFQRWAFFPDPGTVINGGNAEVIVFMEDNYTAIAVYEPGDEITLTVASSSPASGVEIDLNIVGVDFSQEDNIPTPFSRTYTRGDEIRLVAPLSADGNVFVHWLVAGSVATESRVFSRVYEDDATVTAVFERPVYTLSVVSEGISSGVPITVTPADTSGQSDGVTPFTRVFDRLTDVAVTAPESHEGSAFLHWRVGNLVVPNLLTLEDNWVSDITIAAVFEDNGDDDDDGDDEIGCPWTAMPTNASGVFLGQATAEGVPGSADDCVAALDADGNVAGVSQLIVNDGLAYINLALYGDDAATDADEGLTPGEMFTLYLYDASEGDTLTHEQTFTCWQDTNGAPISGCGDVSTTYDFTAEVLVVQSLALSAGWNLVTPTVITDATTPEAFFQNLTGGDLLTVTGSDCSAGSQFYDPSLPDFLNTLGAIDPGRGYWVRVDSEATVEHEGMALVADFSKDLCAGWNLIGYWPTASAPIADAFAGLLEGGMLEVVTGFDPVAGAQFYDPSLPDFLNTLGVVQPGGGYWVRLREAVPGFQYPAVSASKHAASSPPPPAPAPVALTPTTQFMFIHGRVDDGAGHIEVLGEADEVVGAAHVRADGTFGAVAVYGDDPRTEAIEGAQVGERLRLRHGARSYTTNVVFEPDMRLRKAHLTPETQLGDLPLDFTLEGNYPNPFNPTTTLRYGLPETASVRIEVYNALGQRVALLVDEPQQAGWHDVAFDAADLASGLYLYRLSAGTFQQTRQMLLVK